MTERRPAPSGALGAVSVRSFRADDAFVNDRYESINADLERRMSEGFYGDPRLDLARKRLSRIDFENPATRSWIEDVPTVREWMDLIPTAAALDPIYQPHVERLPSGHVISPQMRDWFCNSADARGIRSRSAVFAEVSGQSASSDGGRPQQWLSLACGAAQSVLSAGARVRRLGRPTPVMTMVDIDKTSLGLAAKYAREVGIEANTLLLRGNVLANQRDEAARRRRQGLPSGAVNSFDLVEAVGILEYLQPGDWTYRSSRIVSTRTPLAGAVTFIRNAYDFVKPGGLLVLGNMLDTHPQLAFTLNVVQWPHIQPRSVEAMVTLIRRAAVDAEIQVVLPEDGVYAIYVVNKPDVARNEKPSER